MKMRRLVVLFACLMMAALLGGCGKKAEVTVTDRGVATVLEVKLPKTVGKILEEAQITLGAEDTVTPGIDEKLAEGGEIAISRKNTVKLTVDGETKEVTMIGGTVKDLLEQEGLQLAENQSVSPEKAVWLTDGMEVKVTSSLKITLTHDGTTEEKELPVGTVQDALTAFGATLGEKDRITPQTEEKLSDGMKIVIVRITEEKVTETEEIPYETEKKNDSSLDKGKEKTKTAGENGTKELTYQVIYADGKEESRELLEEKVVKEPVTEVILVGTKTQRRETTTKADDSAEEDKTTERYEVNRVAVPNCDDPNHGYYEIYYSDGSVEYVEY